MEQTAEASASAVDNLSKSPRVCIPQRYVLSLMGFFGIVNAYTMRVCLNVAITVMVGKRNASLTHVDPDACPADEASARKQHGGEFVWDEATQGLVLSAFYWGYVITHIPGGLLATRFGGKWTLSLGLLCTAVFTMLTPLAARSGGWAWLLAVRFLEGLGEGTTMPAMNVLLANWTPPAEKSRLGSLTYSGVIMGAVLGQALSGLVLHATDDDWPVVFYMFGGLAMLWCLVFSCLCYNDPQSHPFISVRERQYLHENIQGIDHEQRAVPWSAVLSSVPLWGLIIAQVGHDWVLFTMVTDLPKYMADVLKFNIKSNGLLSALPYLIMWFTAMLFSYVADLLIRKGCWSVTITRKVFTTIASVGPAAGIVLASYAGCDRLLVVALFSVAMGLMGAFYPGMRVNALDLSPNFAGILMALVNGIGAVAGIITPYLVGLLTPDSTLLQWRTVFWISAGVALLTNLIFVLTASGEIQSWNAQPPKKEQE